MNQDILNTIKAQYSQDEMARIARNAYQLTYERKKIEAKEKRAYELLKELASNESRMFGEYMLYYSYRAGSIDYKKIPELKFVKLEDYRKEQVKIWKLDHVILKEGYTMGTPQTNQAKYTEDGEVL